MALSGMCHWLYSSGMTKRLASEMAADKTNTEVNCQPSSTMNDLSDKVQTVFKVLDRREKLAALPKLEEALASLNSKNSINAQVDRDSTVFGFDTNAVIKISSLSRSKSDNIIDFIKTLPKHHIIIPGQVAQETWNVITRDHHNSKIGQIITMQKTDVQSIRTLLGDVKADRTFDLLQELRAIYQEYQPQNDSDSLRSLTSTITNLKAVAICPFVPRAQFLQLAEVRQKTNTPPGFRDSGDNHGDYFVWADFLLGVCMLNKPNITNIVLVTDDTKSDWSIRGVTHPMLSAEIDALCGKKFQLWGVQDFSRYVELNI